MDVIFSIINGLRIDLNRSHLLCTEPGCGNSQDAAAGSEIENPDSGPDLFLKQFQSQVGCFVVTRAES